LLKYDAERLLGKALEHEYSLLDLLRRPEVNFSVLEQVALTACPSAGVSRETIRAELGDALGDAVIEQLEICAKYDGYISKQKDDVDRVVRFERLALPTDMDYAKVTALSHEARQVLARHRPQTLGQASRMPGITPATVSLLLVHLKKGWPAAFDAPGRPVEPDPSLATVASAA
jgi:tRNA uridine 5-carboxymethylaminomethyl modification enzyme